jgi:two-component sensor histidine kinase
MTGELNPEFARSVLERTPAIIYVYDLKKKRNVFQNRRLGELLDRPPPLALDEEPEWRSLIHPDDAASFPEYHARLANIRPGETLTWQFRMRHANGEWRHFLSHEVLLAPDEQGAPWLIVGDAADITEQKHAEERKNLLLDEMRHRARNFAAVIEGIGRQSLPPTDEATAKFFGTFMGRLRALLDAGDAILASDARTADLVVVAERTLAPFMHSAEPQITISGSSLELSETLAGGLALALHELATNALKYGALLVPDGKVTLCWTINRATDETQQIDLEWKERSGVGIAAPERAGFGSRVIHHAVPHEAKGKVKVDFEPDGVRCRIQFVLPAKTGKGINA